MDNKYTTRQFFLSLFFVVFISAYIWFNPNGVSENMQFKLILVDAAIVIMFCFNDIAKDLIEKLDFKGIFSKKAPTEPTPNE